MSEAELFITVRSGGHEVKVPVGEGDDVKTIADALQEAEVSVGPGQRVYCNGEPATTGAPVSGGDEVDAIGNKQAG